MFNFMPIWRPSTSLIIIALLLTALALLPIGTVVGMMFIGTESDTWQHLADTTLRLYISNTLFLAVAVACGTALIGGSIAWLTTHYRFPGRDVLVWLSVLPLAMPAYVIAYAYTDFLQFSGPLQSALRSWFAWSKDDYWFPEIRSLGGAACIFIMVFYPYVFLLTRTALIERSHSLAEAGRSLGLSPAAVFWRITLPLARPALVGGVALALMETLADYGAVAYFAIDTFTTGIYRAWFALGDRAVAAQLSVALLTVVILVLLLERLSRATTDYAKPAVARRSHDIKLRGAKAWLATMICGLPCLLGFILPALLLLRLVLDVDGPLFSERFWHITGNSFKVAAISAALGCVIALLVAYAVRLRSNSMLRASSQALNIGYAVPGSVLAVGVLIPLTYFDNQLAAWLAHYNFKPGLLLTGTLVALVYAYLVRFFALAWNAIEPDLRRITLSMDLAARNLGERPFGIVRRIHVPLLRHSLLTALLLIFVEVMKELPATLVMRPFNFDTLATHTYQLARDERLAEAALPALIIVLVGVLPLLLLSKTVSNRAHEKAHR